MATTNQMTRELSLTRIFDAPRQLVWKAWTEPERFRRWWGPKGFTSPVAKMDVRVGGVYLACMRSPEGKDYWSKGVYREIVEPDRIAFTDSFADKKGNVVPATYYGMSKEFPLEMLVTVTFEEYDGKTRFTLEHVGIPSGPDRDGAKQGWSESFDKLDELLKELKAEITTRKTSFVAEPGKQEVVITRVFDAPRERVFKAYTDPKLVPQWWGPKSLTTTVDKMDVRPGGVWRFIQHDADGNEFAFRGVYHDIVSPERFVYTFEFEGMPGHVLLETVTLEDLKGKTKATDKVVFQSVVDRDGMLKSGMEEGAAETMDRFAELLAKAGK